MPLTKSLLTRARSRCEMCAGKQALSVLPVEPNDGTPDTAILVCETCRDQITEAAPLDMNHWRCLNDSAWSQTPAVQVTAWRMLTRLNDEAWARELLDMIYLEPETLGWAQNDTVTPLGEIDHFDSNGALLQNGDAVTLTKDLPVKGAGFTAKRGTTVRRISLVPDNAAQIEGRIQGQNIIILTQYVKKA
ncbi:PhnA domain-containing protein [Pseudahrensia aquimaris]|uniref:PhnA domain-containing protein n=1 Tax=Pseudahrensia aquimaris TaxID=744461 RepID=A0ABW3FBY9_9HYPH